mgnify:FL=1
MAFRCLPTDLQQMALPHFPHQPKFCKTMFQEHNNDRQGRIEVICGSMFSGKTEELIRRLKRARIARETLDIYAPLAERIGMQEVKSELEEIAFAELHKEAHDSIVARLNFLREKDSNLVPKIIEQLQKDMEENGIKAVVSGREKTPYSIWRKMQQKNASFEQLSDIMAFRIIVDDVASCYQALGVVHSKYCLLYTSPSPRDA